MSLNMIVREPALKDSLELSQLFNSYRMFYGKPEDLNSAKTFIDDRMISQDSRLFIADDGDKLFGFVQIYPSFSSLALSKVWIVNDLFVSPVYRRQGVARRLMMYIHQQATSEGVFRLLLETLPNNTKAHRLYSDMGYQVENDFLTFSKQLD